MTTPRSPQDGAGRRSGGVSFVPVKATSHRARNRLHALVGEQRCELFSLSHNFHVTLIPAEQRTEALAITGVTGTRAKPEDGWLPCWGSANREPFNVWEAAS